MEQVAWAFRKTEFMLPFRELLKKGSVFFWTQELENSFKKAKEKIVYLVKEGVKSFQMDRVTVINPDWSQIIVSFALMQKYCDCHEINLRCCNEGWKICLVGSQFCSGAESRYAPIEGEALVVAWVLHKARYYVMGCPLLFVGPDHEPLLGLYSLKKALADIDNPRLRKLIERATQFRFEAFYVKGIKNSTPDALS